METRQAAVEAAAELVRKEHGEVARVTLHERLATEGYSADVIDEALRIVASERADAALAQERRRHERAPHLRRLQALAVVPVALVLAFFTMAVGATSVGFGTSLGLIAYLAPFGILVLPAVAAGLLAAADAGKWVARAGLAALMMGLPVALLYGFFRQTEDGTDEITLEGLLILTALVAIPSLAGYATGSRVSAARR